MNNSLLPFLWFLAILALIPIALWLLKRTPMGGAGAGGYMRVIATLPISPNQRILTVEVGQGEDRQWLVLGVTGQQITTLHVMPPQAEAPSAAGQATFAQLLSAKLRGYTVRLDSWKPALAFSALLAASAAAWAQNAPPPATVPLLIGQGAGGSSYSVPIQTLLFFTALGFLPAVLLMMTGFTRIVIVLSLMRQALGTQAAPPNQVIVGLSLFLTFFVMSPTLDKVYAEAWAPYSAGTIGFEVALQRAEPPMRSFMLKQTRQADVSLFTRLAKLDASIKPEDVPFKVLVPAFVTSELKSAFQIAFLIFIPFLVIDMIVSSVLMSLGMMMLSPVLVALPFKLMLFVLADGWNLLLGSLAASFAT